MQTRDWTTILLVVLGAVILLPILGMVFGGFGGGYGMMGPGAWGPGAGRGMGRGMMGPGMMGGYGVGGGFGGFGLLTLVLLIAGVVLITLAITRREPRTDDPLATLKHRLAKGEITREQYEELKQTLQ